MKPIDSLLFFLALGRTDVISTNGLGCRWKEKTRPLVTEQERKADFESVLFSNPTINLFFLNVKVILTNSEVIVKQSITESYALYAPHRHPRMGFALEDGGACHQSSSKPSYISYVAVYLLLVLSIFMRFESAADVLFILYRAVKFSAHVVARDRHLCLFFSLDLNMSHVAPRASRHLIVARRCRILSLEVIRACRISRGSVELK